MCKGLKHFEVCFFYVALRIMRTLTWLSGEAFSFFFSVFSLQKKLNRQDDNITAKESNRHQKCLTFCAKFIKSACARKNVTQ